MILLDTGVLGYLCRTTRNQHHVGVLQWFEQLVDQDVIVGIPEIADYELRRGLLRAEQELALARLDRYGAALEYIPLSTPAMRRAATIWSDTRRSGRTTADDRMLDGDVILAAQALELMREGNPVTIATTNVKHLSWFVDARTWEDVDRRVAFPHRRVR